MSKFKSHQEQSNIIGSDYLLARSIADRQFIKNNCDRQYDVIELKKLTTIFENLKVKYWLDYGTLLGAYRNKKVIKHDFDLDVSVQTDIDSEIICEALSSDYYISHHSPNVYINIYPKNNSKFTMAHIDIYFTRVRGKFIQSVPFQFIYFPKFFFDELQNIELDRQMFKAPRHLEEYLKFKYGTDFMEEKPNFGPTENIIVPKNEYVAYTCGVFDLFHIGHLNLFKRIKDNFDKVIVGVHNDQDVMSYKNKPTIPYSDRLEIIKSCKYVDCVYENAEVITTDETLIKLNADYVIAGRENEQFISKHYPVDFRSLHLIERTSNISTSKIRSMFV